MTMRECYEAIGGNYEAVLGCLHSEALIRRFTLKFLEDQSYIQLKQALKNHRKHASTWATISASIQPLAAFS